MTKPAKIKFFLVTASICVFFIAPLVFAGSEKKFVLNDGSVIQAEVLSYSKGVYQLRSKSLGKFSLAEDKIQSIQFPGANANNPPAISAGDSSKGLGGKLDSKQVDQMKNKIMADPQISNLVDELQKDPTMQQILGDKELLQAIEKGDVGRLIVDPKIQALMNNKEVGKILERTK